MCNLELPAKSNFIGLALHLLGRSYLRNFCLAVGLGLLGCKTPDDGPKPHIFPAYPVQNLPPANPRVGVNGIPQGTPGMSGYYRRNPILYPLESPRTGIIPPYQSPPATPPR